MPIIYTDKKIKVKTMPDSIVDEAKERKQKYDEAREARKPKSKRAYVKKPKSKK